MKCALPGMYGRKAPIDYAALSKSYLDITKESLLSEPEDDFHKALEEYKKTLENALESMDLAYNVDENKKYNYEKELEVLKRELIQKDKEENE